MIAALAPFLLYRQLILWIHFSLGWGISTSQTPLFRIYVLYDILASLHDKQRNHVIKIRYS
jgi:hypothetical protein